MRKRFIKHLRCPRCFSYDLRIDIRKSSDEEIVEGKLTCPDCATSFSIECGIPILVLESEKASSGKAEKVKDFEEDLNPEYEIERPEAGGRLYKWLLDYKMSKCLPLTAKFDHGATIIVSACGSGLDAEYWANWGFEVVSTDYSFDALLRARERAKRRNLKFDLICSDAENLPFKSGFATCGFVHDGLHHLELPHRAVHELWRCSRELVIICEPVEALVTNLAIKLGLSIEYENATNYIYRFHPRELPRLFKALGAVRCKVSRYLMWYQHRPNKAFSIFEADVPFKVFQTIFNAANFLFSSFGNKMVCWAEKETCGKNITNR